MEVYSAYECLFSLLASPKISIQLKRQVVRNSPNIVLKFLIEACHNLLQNNLRFSPEDKKHLVRARKILRKIVRERKKADLSHITFLKTLPLLLKLVGESLRHA